MANRLADETSPYLRQHRDNPVDWYPWGEEAFARARAEDRPILLSVGYSACHWCHVMAHESFADPEVAAVMNRHFVNVKVDREERPDVDSLYMDAVQAMTGRGGWPMTVFLKPDGRPFYGGTYYPKPQFLQLLAALDDAWRTRRAEIDTNAEALVAAVATGSRLTPADDLPGIELLNAALNALAQRFDAEHGGFGSAPKFPQTMSLELVLRAVLAGGGEGAATVVTRTLDAMASGGMYDHIGFGFARYSTDERWMIPHFEKMLPDQALMARLYLHAAQALGQVRWLQVASDVITYVIRDLLQPEGGFSSSEDADSPAPDGTMREGLVWTWVPSEVRAVFAHDPALAEEALAWWGITDGGNIEGRSVPYRTERGDLMRPPRIEAARAALFAARSTRPQPALDDKVLLEWNALMLATIAEAALVTGREDWLRVATANAEFLEGRMRDDEGRWMRSWQAGRGAHQRAFAGDHAALVEGLTRLYEAGGDPHWLALAVETADAMLEHFWDAEHGGLFTVAEDGEALVVRQKDVLDNATPSANSLAANALYRLAALTGERRYEHQADRILQLVAPAVSKAPLAFSLLLAAVDLRRTGTVEVVVPGRDRMDLVREVGRRYMPNRVLAWGERVADSPLWAGRDPGAAFVCRQWSCQLPVTTVEDLAAQLAAATPLRSAEVTPPS
jgi:uncharacterized protein YyaL (SSP411 family)